MKLFKILIPLLLVAALSAQASDVAGRVVSVEGSVLVRADSGKKGVSSSHPAKAGDVIRQNDVINTASNGKLKILLGDKTIVDLGPSTLFKVAEYQANHGPDRNVDLQMSYGNLRAAVSKALSAKGKFRIRTPAATMGVRGTEFLIHSQIGSPKDVVSPVASKKDSETKTKVTVVQGKVAVTQSASAPPLMKKGTALASTPKTVLLTAGTQLTSTASAPASIPVTLTPAQVSVLETSTKVIDNTFTKAINLDLSGESGAGAVTQATLVQTLSTTVVQPISASNSGFAGTFGTGAAFSHPTVQVPVGTLRTIHVVITP